MTATKLFLGIDGGGTKCKVRLEDDNKQLLAEATSGPANIATSASQAQEAILSATMTALTKAKLPASAVNHIHAFAGLAGANVSHACMAMREWQAPFAHFDFTTDVHIACLGAHQYHDGGIIILGTGFCAGLVKQGSFSEIGGHGLWLSDGASGAWIGLSLVKYALEVLDTISPSSLLIETLLAQLNCHCTEDLVALTLHASPHYFAQFAPLVFSNSQDPYALRILQSAAHFIERYLYHLQHKGADKVALVGGIAQPIRPWLNDKFAALLVPPALPPEHAALSLARRQFLT
ncbi:BadF/BadG/BcrA/BcrD ATPase family protein [Pseudoalteromonas piscicida]|uniref:BadF/BadG/BcrA/BcrD ATPase family protein n=1 Tax=Pseudoalteromonas piscicida TaxID=43662 RepID=UPI0030B64840